MAVILSLVLHLDLKRDNARRDALYGKPETYEDGGDIDVTTRSQTDPELQKRLGLVGMSPKEIEALGDRHPLFRVSFPFLTFSRSMFLSLTRSSLL